MGPRTPNCRAGYPEAIFSSAMNTGSVGRPKDGDWRAGFALVTFGDGAPVHEFVRVPYDVDRAAQAIDSGAARATLEAMVAASKQPTQPHGGGRAS